METTCAEDKLQTAVAYCACKFPLVPLCHEHADRHLTDTSSFHFPLPLSASQVIDSKEVYIRCKPWLFQLNANYDLLCEKFQSLSTGEDQIESAYQTLLHSAAEANDRLKKEFSLQKEKFRSEIEQAIAETRSHALEGYESVNVLAQMLWNNQLYLPDQSPLFTFQAECIKEQLPSILHIALNFASGLDYLDMGKCSNPLTDRIEELTNKLTSQEESHLRQIQTLMEEAKENQDSLNRLKLENEDLKEQCKAQITQLTASQLSLKDVQDSNTQSLTQVQELNSTLQTTLQQYQALKAKSKEKRKHRLILKKEKQTQVTSLEEALVEANRRNSSLEARLRAWEITSDPPIESQESVPDLSTPESRFALSKFGPYIDQDSEHLLLKRGPILDDDEVYIGQWNTRNQRHGYGKCLYKDGDVYEGQWRNGWKTGKGRYIWANGDVYIGEFQQDKYEGFGTYYSYDGDIYTGGWLNDNAHGIGSHTFGTGSKYSGDRYIGEYRNDKFQGLGAYFEADGFMCIGSWRLGNMHGKGLKGWTDDGSVYFGGFQDGDLQGFGCYLWPDGDVYEGEWKMGKRHGQGKLTHPGKCEEGVWIDHELIRAGTRP